MIFPKQARDSVLFITLDSCRYDTFAAADAPNLKAVGPLHKAQAPSYYTYGSHSAMFVGFTPGLAHLAEPILNPKFGKLFKLVGGGFPGKGTEGYELRGRNIVEGFRNRGFRTCGTGAVGWFDPSVPTGLHLTDSFDAFFYAGDTWSLDRQLAWLAERLAEPAEGGAPPQGLAGHHHLPHPEAPRAAGPRRTHDASACFFAFLNIGETHVPYYHQGAPWSADDNPCRPFQTLDRAEECRTRQRACLEYADSRLAGLLAAFADSTVLVCGDHGDCWGEDGLWEHGISHPATLTVPLLVRVRGEAVEAAVPASAVASVEEPRPGTSLFSRLKRRF